mmetsp:Transcript_107332/g.256347  ORF Transcript_107332/g.256347 Transcript_107332/m.256347 type:complete len:328 (-) Transcript_107332:277-1260(-)
MPVKVDGAAGSFNSTSLIQKLRLMISGELSSLQFLPFQAANHNAAVPNMTQEQRTSPMIVEASRRSGARPSGIHLAIGICAVNKHVQAAKLLNKEALHARRAHPGVSHQHPWQRLLDKVRHIVAVRAMTVRNCIDGEFVLHPQDRPGVLVWAARLQALLANDAVGCINTAEIIPVEICWLPDLRIPLVPSPNVPITPNNAVVHQTRFAPLAHDIDGKGVQAFPGECRRQTLAVLHLLSIDELRARMSSGCPSAIHVGAGGFCQHGTLAFASLGLLQALQRTFLVQLVQVVKTFFVNIAAQPAIICLLSSHHSVPESDVLVVFVPDVL